MDPTANLKEQRQIVARMQKRIADAPACAPSEWREQDVDALIADGERLAELAQALDEWMTRGGFPPAQWHKAARR